MYIVIVTAHQRKMVQAPHFFWAAWWRHWINRNQPAPSKPQINFVPLTYVGKINMRKSGQNFFSSRMHHSGDRHMFPYGNVRQVPRKRIIINLNRPPPWCDWNLVMPLIIYNICCLWLLKWEKKQLFFARGSLVTPIHACSHVGTARYP